MGYPEHPAKGVSRTWLIFAIILAVAGFVFFVPVKSKNVYSTHQSGTKTTKFPSGAAIDQPTYETRSAKRSYTTWDLIVGND